MPRLALTALFDFFDLDADAEFETVRGSLSSGIITEGGFTEFGRKQPGDRQDLSFEIARTFQPGLDQEMITLMVGIMVAGALQFSLFGHLSLSFHLSRTLAVLLPEWCLKRKTKIFRKIRQITPMTKMIQPAHSILHYPDMSLIYPVVCGTVFSFLSKASAVTTMKIPAINSRIPISPATE
jgi:hypothetical protein